MHIAESPYRDHTRSTVPPVSRSAEPGRTRTGAEGLKEGFRSLYTGGHVRTRHRGSRGAQVASPEPVDDFPLPQDDMDVADFVRGLRSIKF